MEVAAAAVDQAVNPATSAQDFGISGEALSL